MIFPSPRDMSVIQVREQDRKLPRILPLHFTSATAETEVSTVPILHRTRKRIRIRKHRIQSKRRKRNGTKETSAKAEYSTDVKLYAPQDYNDEKVRIELVQDGKTTTLVDGEVVEFPYSLKMTSDSGSSATAYVYVLDDDGNILKKVEYEGVPFSK